MESGPPVLSKRLWHIVRVLFYMFRKGISKSKLMVDLHLMMKRGTLAGKKAIGHLMFLHHQHHHSSTFSCRSSDVNVAFAPREYEFSCSNTPVAPSYPFHLGSRRRRNNHHHNYFSCIHPTHTEDDEISAVQKALEILNSDVSGGAVSPFMPGFGKSPAVRQLRITDSPFPVKESGADVDSHVDKEAEEFIERFYEQLRRQKRTIEMDPRYREMMMAGY